MDETPETLPARKPRRGRPKFEPTPAQRVTALALKAAGSPHAVIASIMEIPLRTFDRHFKREIAQGHEEVTARIAHGLIGRALGGDNDAAKFFLRTRAGWTTRTEVTGAEGGPIDIRNISTDQLTAALIAFAESDGAGEDGAGAEEA